MPNQNAAERVRSRIREWNTANGRGSARRLAQSVPGKYGEPRGDSWISGVLRGEQDITLRDLDALAHVLGVPPGDLVRRNGDHYLEVIPSEMRFLFFLRALPDTVRQHLMRVCEYLLGFQEQLLKEQKDTVDQRTKLARLHRHLKRSS